jgi:hypothetical protein
MKKTIINYSTSGLGNRLRPLASCYAIAKQTNRELIIYWDNITPNGCLAKWNELFENQISEISLEEIKQLDDCALFTETDGVGHGYEREYQKFGRDALKQLSTKYPSYPKSSFNYSFNNKNIIIYDNGFQPNVNIKDSHEFIQNLKPIKEIQDKIDYYTTKLNLSENVIGIHARGTDFGDYLEQYMHDIQCILNKNPSQQFFLSTEDPIYEEKIKEKFGNNIIFRKKDNYIIKDNSKPWNDHNSFYITKEHAQEAVEDIFLLSKTNIQIFHPASTFCEIARIINNKNE